MMTWWFTSEGMQRSRFSTTKTTWWEPTPLGRRGHTQGTSSVKVDGDSLRGYSENIYLTAPSNGIPIEAPLDAIQFEYAEPFSFEAFQTTGQGNDFYHGVVDELGDTWHVLTFWDVDPENSEGERDDQSNDGKIALFVVDPKTPSIAFEAPDGEAYYTTSPKLYDTPHIHPQRTYLTSGVQIRLTNISNEEPIHYQVDDGPIQDYDQPDDGFRAIRAGGGAYASVLDGQRPATAAGSSHGSAAACSDRDAPEDVVREHSGARGSPNRGCGGGRASGGNPGVCLATSRCLTHQSTFGRVFAISAPNCSPEGTITRRRGCRP